MFFLLSKIYILPPSSSRSRFRPELCSVLILAEPFPPGALLRPHLRRAVSARSSAPSSSSRSRFRVLLVEVEEGSEAAYYLGVAGVFAFIFTKLASVAVEGPGFGNFYC